MYRATQAEVARVLRRYSVHDPYLLVFGPDSSDAPGLYVLRVVLAVPEDKATDHHWTATTPLPALLGQQA